MDLSTLLSSLSGRKSGSSGQSKMTVISQGDVLPQKQKRNYNSGYHANGPKRFDWFFRGLVVDQDTVYLKRVLAISRIRFLIQINKNGREWLRFVTCKRCW